MEESSHPSTLLIGEPWRKQPDPELSLKLQDRVGPLIDLESASPEGPPPEAVVAHIDSPLVSAPKLGSGLEGGRVPPVVGEKGVSEMEKLVVVAGESVLMAKFPRSGEDAVIPHHHRIWDKLVHFESEILYPLFEGSYSTDFSLDVEQVPVEAPLPRQSYQQQSKLLAGQHVFRIIFSLGDKGSQAARPVAPAEDAPVAGGHCDVVVREIIEDIALFQVQASIGHLSLGRRLPGHD